MSLEWARARLLEHREALRRLCESRATAPAPPSRAAAPDSATVVPLRASAAPRTTAEEAARATVIKFVRRRRRA